jgi:hypothetical protein
VDDLRVGVAGEAVVVVALGERTAVLGEELRVDPVEHRLVVGERAVEVEDDRAARHARQTSQRPAARTT